MLLMKKLRLDDAIHSIDKVLLVIVVACFAAGGIGTLIQLIRWGVLFEPSGGN